MVAYESILRFQSIIYDDAMQYRTPCLPIYLGTLIYGFPRDGPVTSQGASNMIVNLERGKINSSLQDRRSLDKLYHHDPLFSPAESKIIFLYPGIFLASYRLPRVCTLVFSLRGSRSSSHDSGRSIGQSGPLHCDVSDRSTLRRLVARNFLLH